MDCFNRGLEVSTDVANRTNCLQGTGAVFFAQENYSEAMHAYQEGEKNYPSICLREDIARCREAMDQCRELTDPSIAPIV
jgi:hypothetical protein